MVNITVQIGSVLAVIVLFIFGLLLWVSGDFAHAILISGLGRFFGGLISMAVAVFLIIIITRNS